MRLRDFKFNSIKNKFPIVGLAIRCDNGDWFEGETIGETLSMIPIEFADMQIVETHWYFNEFCITVTAN